MINNKLSEICYYFVWECSLYEQTNTVVDKIKHTSMGNTFFVHYSKFVSFLSYTLL